MTTDDFLFFKHIQLFVLPENSTTVWELYEQSDL